MAKTLNSICFTTLLLVVLLISAEIPKSEAQCNKFIGEGPEGTPSNPCRQRQCFASCKKLFPATCGAQCEIHDKEDHCHCLGR